MDFQTMIMGFGFGGVGGAIIADFLHITYMQTPLFILGGVVGAALCSGVFGDVGDITDMFN